MRTLNLDKTRSHARRAFFERDQAIDSRHLYQPTLWSYGLYHPTRRPPASTCCTRSDRQRVRRPIDDLLTISRRSPSVRASRIQAVGNAALMPRQSTADRQRQVLAVPLFETLSYHKQPTTRTAGLGVLLLLARPHRRGGGDVRPRQPERVATDISTTTARRT